MQAERNLAKFILPFWVQHTKDEQYGGFIGVISNDLVPNHLASKGAVLCARILWTYSAAYQFSKDPVHLEMASRAYNYLVDHFWDHANGGVYWMLDFKGEALDPAKEVYAQAFAIYGLAEYHRATGHAQSLDYAIKLFELLRLHSLDPEYGGYRDGFNQDFSRSQHSHLMGGSFQNATDKTMNTNLHVLEAFTNLVRVWDTPQSRQELQGMIEVTQRHIINPTTYHFSLFFERDWKPLTKTVSYGHDIEGSWLLQEAAEVLGDAKLLSAVKDTTRQMAEAALRQGIDKDGALLYETDDRGHTDADKHWWPQAEAAVGFLNAYQLTNDERFFDASYRVWQFIEAHMTDKVHGEWFSRIEADGALSHTDLKVSSWKCPYHNGRACMEIIHRLSHL